MGMISTITLTLLGLLGAGLWVGFALLATGIISLELMRDMPIGKLLAFDLWASLNAVELVALPMFILMGELLFQTRLSENLFKGLAPLMNRLPGQLLHTNIIGCTLFAAVSGSSAATTATVGRMTLDELDKRGYDRELAMGSLCGAGTLGFLIPPSIILILYGVLAEVSIIELFIAGVIPGLLLATAYMAYVAFASRKSHIPSDADQVGKLAGAMKLLPVGGLIILVLGSMYFGIASPSEASIIGVLGALIIAVSDRALNKYTLMAALMGTIKTVSMIGLIITGALFLSKAMAYLGLPNAIASEIALFGLSPIALIAVLILFYAILGMVLDGLSAIVMTLPIILPIVVAAGFSPVWFGIFLVIVVEMSQITPPVGFNLFVVQNMTGESLSRIARASFPFFCIMLGFALLIAIVPNIVLWLPSMM